MAAVLLILMRLLSRDNKMIPSIISKDKVHIDMIMFSEKLHQTQTGV